MNPPGIDQAERFAKQLDQETLLYLETRGVSEQVARRHLIGKRRDKMVTFPNIVTIDGKRRSYGIKWRWLPSHQPEDSPKYMLMRGSVGKSIYNFDILKRHWTAVVITESIMDVLILESLEIPAVCSFAGGPTWGEQWGRFFDCDYIVNLAEFDGLKKKGNGQVFRPGEEYANRRAKMLGLYGGPYQKVITVPPPDHYSDIGEAAQKGYDIKSWLVNVVDQYRN